MKKEKVCIDISSWSIVKVILIILGFYLIYLIRDVIALFFIVMILVAAFSPTVSKWAKKITRPGALIAMILILLAVLTLIGILVVPPFVEQSAQLIQNLPGYFAGVSWVQEYLPQIKDSLANFGSQIGDIPSTLISFTSSLFGGIVSIIMAVVLFVYFLSDEQGLKKFAFSFFPEENREKASEIFKKVANKAGGWLRGQMYLGAIIAVVNLIALTIIGVPYAVALAVISGILEIVPTIGPILSGVLAALVALSISPIKAILVIAWYILVQQLEGTLIVPKVMHKTVGLSPVTIIFAILIGAKIYGIMGVILSVPLTASILVIAQEWRSVKSLVSTHE